MPGRHGQGQYPTRPPGSTKLPQGPPTQPPGVQRPTAYPPRGGKGSGDRVAQVPPQPGRRGTGL